MYLLRSYIFIFSVLYFVLGACQSYAALDCHVFANLHNLNVKINETKLDLQASKRRISDHPRIQSLFSFQIDRTIESLATIKELAKGLETKSLTELKNLLEEVVKKSKTYSKEIALAISNKKLRNLALPKGTQHMGNLQDILFNQRKAHVLYYETKKGFLNVFLNSGSNYQRLITRRVRSIVVDEHFGNFKNLKNYTGIYELKFSQSLRVYYTHYKGYVIVLHAGLKDTQTKDIAISAKFLKELLALNE